MANTRSERIGRRAGGEEVSAPSSRGERATHLMQIRIGPRATVKLAPRHGHDRAGTRAMSPALWFVAEHIVNVPIVEAVDARRQIMRVRPT